MEKSARGGESFTCVRNTIACSEFCVDVDFEMIAFEAPNDGMLMIEISAGRTLLT